MKQFTEEQIKEFGTDFRENEMGSILFDELQLNIGYLGFRAGFKKAQELFSVQGTKPLSEITDEDAGKLATIVLFDPQIEDWNPDEVWSSDGNTEGDFYFLEVGMRCWSGVLVIKEKSGSIALFDEDENLMEIYNLVSVVDFLRSKGYILPTQTA